jgi:hypothetical protein
MRGNGVHAVTAPPVVISRHALIRLTQRANVRTVADLLAAAGELWQAADR